MTTELQAAAEEILAKEAEANRDEPLLIDEVLSVINSAEFVTRGLGFPHGGMQPVGSANYAVLKIPGRTQLHAKHWFEDFKKNLNRWCLGE